MQQAFSRVNLLVTASLLHGTEQLNLSRVGLRSLSQSRPPGEKLHCDVERRCQKVTTPNQKLHLNDEKILVNNRAKIDTVKKYHNKLINKSAKKDTVNKNHIKLDLRNERIFFNHSSDGVYLRKEKFLDFLLTSNSVLPSKLCFRSFSSMCSGHRLRNRLHVLSNHKTSSHHCNRKIWDIFKKCPFGDYSVLDNVGKVYESHEVPSHIRCPPYAKTGQPLEGPKNPEVKSGWQVDIMRESCRLARSVLNGVGEHIQEGMTTEDIDFLVHEKAIQSGAYPSPLNYHGFPKSVCTSVNNVACHGIPDDRKLMSGDIISVDVTVFHNGYHGDCCETFLIGDVDEAGKHLVESARRCRDEAINICGPGVPFSNIGARVEEVAKEKNVTVVPAFIGHGIGRYFHGPPDIYHCYNDYPGTMEEGMTFTIEPIVAQGSEEVVILEDGWTAMMLDNGRAAQFEHTVLITGNGHEILTDYF